MTPFICYFLTFLYIHLAFQPRGYAFSLLGSASVWVCCCTALRYGYTFLALIHATVVLYLSLYLAWCFLSFASSLSASKLPRCAGLFALVQLSSLHLKTENTSWLSRYQNGCALLMFFVACLTHLQGNLLLFTIVAVLSAGQQHQIVTGWIAHLVLCFKRLMIAFNITNTYACILDYRI